MKKHYIKPSVTLDIAVVNPMMETFSLPNTGSLDDPSFGQACGFNFDEDEDESDKQLPTFHVWDTNF